MKTYDILNAGPKNRFMANKRIVSNSGNILQPQNLPQNHLPDLTLARDIVKSGDFELLDMIFGNVPNVLSELIRTVLIPKDGCRFIVADFSAIEARVLSWIAGEQWRIDTFKNGGDIYCASASQMFHVPVEKHGVNGHLRQKGKIILGLQMLKRCKEVWVFGDRISEGMANEIQIAEKRKIPILRCSLTSAASYIRRTNTRRKRRDCGLSYRCRVLADPTSTRKYLMPDKLGKYPIYVFTNCVIHGIIIIATYFNI